MKSPDPRDPRFRLYRGVSLGLYLVVAVGFSSLIIFSVFRSVLSMTPSRPDAVGESLTEEQCLLEAQQLFGELEQQRKSQADEVDVTHSDQRFLKFRTQWLERKRAKEARCALSERDRARTAFALLERILDLYTTASVQFSGAVGPAVDELKNQFRGSAP